MVGLAVALGWDSARTIQNALQPDLVSGIVLILLQVAYLPNAVMMALGYVSGPGFVVGTGTHYSIFGTTTEPLPAIPLLGALPSPGAGPGWPVLLGLVALGFLVGAVRATRSGDRAPARIGREIAVAVPVLYGLLAVSGVLASGALGPGRMADVGVNAPVVALTSTALIAAGLSAGLFARLGLKAAGMVDTVDTPLADPDDEAFFTPAPALRVLEAESVASGVGQGSASTPPSAETAEVSPPSAGTPSA